MPEYSIRNLCHINTNWDTDTFVGINCDGNGISINFPLGFHLSDDDKEIRKDILLMLNTIATTTAKQESKIQQGTSEFDNKAMPIQAYLYLIARFMENGVYKEKEVHYQVANRGKINWNKTIKTQKPFLQGAKAFYLNFVTRSNPVSEKEMITLIHEFCVYDSFQKLGWIFTSAMPPKPRIKFNKKLFLSVVREKLKQTNNDDNRMLFKSMIAVIDQLDDENISNRFKYGTSRFEYVWEAMIDRAYGIKGKETYFPTTTWHLPDGEHANSDLLPDSIMIWNGNVYVLDAKYYKYGATQRPSDLPQSTSINKQITYGEYIAEQKKFKKLHGSAFTVFNAFLMPCDAMRYEDTIVNIGEAVGDWKMNKKPYERVQGIIIDVKFLMKTYMHHDEEEIMRLAECIEKAFSKEGMCTDG